MELSLRLDTLGVVEMRYLRSRERYRDWPTFELLAASRQARIMAYLSRDVVEQLHQQILLVESAVGLDEEDEEELKEDINENEMDAEATKPSEREGSNFSPAFAQALERLNDLARQRLPEGSGGIAGEQSTQESELTVQGEHGSDLADEEDALEQLQDAFVQMMEVVRELAEELSTDALKLTSRFRCARTGIGFTRAEQDDVEDENESETQDSENVIDLELELALVLQLFEEGRSRADELPTVELRLDVDDFEHLHETLDFALNRERTSRRRRR